MELVVDANILIASFLKEAKTRELLLDARFTLYAPSLGKNPSKVASPRGFEPLLADRKSAVLTRLDDGDAES